MRLKSKNARNAIIQKRQPISSHPIIAEAYFQQFSRYFEEHANVSLSTGEIAYEAVATAEPAGKHIQLTRQVTVRLKLINFTSDLEALASYGLAGLRRLQAKTLRQLLLYRFLNHYGCDKGESPPRPSSTIS